MSDNGKDTVRDVFGVSVVDGQYKVDIHSRHLGEICTALKLLNLEVDNALIAASQPKVIPVDNIPPDIKERLK